MSKNDYHSIMQSHIEYYAKKYDPSGKFSVKEGKHREVAVEQPISKISERKTPFKSKITFIRSLVFTE